MLSGELRRDLRLIAANCSQCDGFLRWGYDHPISNASRGPAFELTRGLTTIAFGEKAAG